MARYFYITSFEEANIIRDRAISKNLLPSLNSKNIAYAKYKHGHCNSLVKCIVQ